MSEAALTPPIAPLPPVAEEASRPPPPMSWTTLPRYLVGSREAILQIAATPAAVWFGLAWVLLAGIAREYDGEDLLHEPWHLLIPLGASLATATILFHLLWGCAGSWAGYSLRQYRVFLSLYWLTAPLAWLYAIPVERLFSAGEATQFNLWLLLLVSVWRVALMIRVASVLFRVSLGRALFVVMLFADTVALLVLSFVPFPMIGFMGGIRLSDSAQVIVHATIDTVFLGVITYPVWAIGSLVVACKLRSPLSPDPSQWKLPLSRWHWGLPGLMLLVGLLILPGPQAEQRLRRQAETLLASGEIAAALTLMSAHAQADFPPHWDPPPHTDYRNPQPPVLDVLEAIDRHRTPVADWVLREYQQKFMWMLGYSMYSEWYWNSENLNDSDFERHLTILERYPELWPEVMSEYTRQGLSNESKPEPGGRFPSQGARPPALRERLKKLLERSVPAGTAEQDE